MLYALGEAVACIEFLLLSLCNWTWQLNRPLRARDQRALEAREPSFSYWLGTSLRTLPPPDSLIEIGIAQAVMQSLLSPAMIVLYRTPNIVMRESFSMQRGLVNGAFSFGNWPMIKMDVLLVCFWYVPATCILGPLMVFSLLYMRLISESRAKILIGLILRFSLYIVWGFL